MQFARNRGQIEQLPAQRLAEELVARKRLVDDFRLSKMGDATR